MKLLVGKIFLTGILTVFTNIASAIRLEAAELKYEADIQIVSVNNELSLLSSEDLESGSVLLLSLGILGLMYARRRLS